MNKTVIQETRKGLRLDSSSIINYFSYFGEDVINNFSGVIGHSALYGKWDPGPVFNWDKLFP